MNPISPMLDGIRILDLSRLLPGPYCTLLLADLGAEVIKVETPGAGDYARIIPENLGGDGVFQIVNRNKKSLALNYRNARGLEVFLRLAREADVVVEGFRPGSVDRWGLGYAALSALNPRLIYCSLSGYGQDGPYAQRAGHDLNYVALGGLLALNGVASGPPIPPGVQIADLAGGMLAAVAILGALVRCGQTGQGAYLDVSMLDAVVSWVAPFAGAEFLRTGQNPQRGAMTLSGGLPCYTVYRTADGQYLALSALEPHFWAAFCHAIERPDLLPRQFDLSLTADLAALFATRPRADWLAALAGADACLEPVNEMSDVARDPQVRHRGLVIGTEAVAAQGAGFTLGSPFTFAGVRPAPAPRLGEHTREVLSNAGLGEAEIQELAHSKIVRLG
jgi:alpha-methylacyl-CoA racemase